MVLFLVLAVLFVSLMFFLPLPGWGRRRPRGQGSGGKRKAASSKNGPAPLTGILEPAASFQTVPEAPADLAPPNDDKPPPLFAVQLRYEGGDWPANPEALRKLCEFYAAEYEAREVRVELGLRGRSLPSVRPDFVFATGHHGFALLGPDRQGLLEYLGAGGVVLVEDNNGLDYYFRLFLEETWPHHKLEPVTAGPLFTAAFALSFYPKIRRHQGRPSRLFRIRLDERDLDFYYSYSCDLGDGWQNQPHLRVAPDKRRLALEMGANFLAYALKTR